MKNSFALAFLALLESSKLGCVRQERQVIRPMLPLDCSRSNQYGFPQSEYVLSNGLRDFVHQDRNHDSRI